MLSLVRTSLTRILLALMLAFTMGFSAISIMGCTDDANNQSSAAQADDEQDNCYGNDLPARK